MIGRRAPLKRTPLKRVPFKRRPRRFTAEQRLAHKEYVLARLRAWERDGGECQVPVLVARQRAAGVNLFPAWLLTPCSGRIDPHHVWPQQRYPERRADVDVLLCLCRQHHESVHAHPAVSRQYGLLK